MDPDSFILTIATQRHLGRCVLAGPRVLEGDSSGARGIDITPSVLALLGVDRPGYVEGRDLTSSDDGARGAFVMPTTPLEHSPDIELLVEAIERDDLEHLPARRRPQLRRFAVRALRRQWMDARIRFDFKAARSCAQLLVRLDASATNLWWLAFSCDRYGDIEGVHEASRQLLEGYPGSAEAILSAVLGTRQATPDQLRTIVDAIDPSTLAHPGMQATWARSAIKAGMADAGIEVFEKLVHSGLSLPMDRVALSAALQSRGDSERALAILGSLGSAPTAALNVRILRANVLLGAGRIEEARAVASAILESYPLEKRATTILSQTPYDEDL